MKQVNNYRIRALILFVPLLVAAGPVADGLRPAAGETGRPGKSIAIVAGTTTEISLAAARFITRSLTEKSLLTVLSQEKIAHALPKYPAVIKGPFTANYVAGFKEEYSRTDLAKVRMLQQTLEVDYLYVLWAPSTERGRGTVTHKFIAQLFQAPESSAVDNGTFESSATGDRSFVFFRNCMSILSIQFNEPTREQELEELKRDGDKVADHIVSVINRGPGK